MNVTTGLIRANCGLTCSNRAIGDGQQTVTVNITTLVSCTAGNRTTLHEHLTNILVSLTMDIDITTLNGKGCGSCLTIGDSTTQNGQLCGSQIILINVAASFLYRTLGDGATGNGQYTGVIDITAIGCNTAGNGTARDSCIALVEDAAAGLCLTAGDSTAGNLQSRGIGGIGANIQVTTIAGSAIANLTACDGCSLSAGLSDRQATAGQYADITAAAGCNTTVDGAAGNRSRTSTAEADITAIGACASHGNIATGDGHRLCIVDITALLCATTGDGTAFHLKSTGIVNNTAIGGRRTTGDDTAIHIKCSTGVDIDTAAGIAGAATSHVTAVHIQGATSGNDKQTATSSCSTIGLGNHICALKVTGINVYSCITAAVVTDVGNTATVNSSFAGIKVAAIEVQLMAALVNEEQTTQVLIALGGFECTPVVSVVAICNADISLYIDTNRCRNVKAIQTQIHICRHSGCSTYRNITDQVVVTCRFGEGSFFCIGVAPCTPTRQGGASMIFHAVGISATGTVIRMGIRCNSYVQGICHLTINQDLDSAGASLCTDNAVTIQRNCTLSNQAYVLSIKFLHHRNDA